MDIKRAARFIFCLALLIAATGCATASIASAGAIAGLAASSIATSADVYRMGKLDAVEMVKLDDQIAAVELAARDLKLTIQSKEHYDKGRWRCMIADDRDSHFRVYLQRRTENMCRTRIDVGVFGSEGTARLFLARMRRAKNMTETPVATPSTLNTANH
jgi:hypothetical protein